MSRSTRQSSPDEPNTPPVKLTFEDALDELEKLVGGMEGGDLSLEQSLAAHKRGLELARFCQQRLESAQQQVRVLEGEVLKNLPVAPDPEASDG
ncbi:MAG: exodeoxyribonuclease VII small subunit [Betaproteobacteria bacterium]